MSLLLEVSSLAASGMARSHDHGERTGPDTTVEPEGIRKARADRRQFAAVALVTKALERPSAVLVVEVSESRLRFDRLRKASLDARAGIPECWIVNLVDRVVEIHREPAPMARRRQSSYRSVTTLRRA